MLLRISLFFILVALGPTWVSRADAKPSWQRFGMFIEGVLSQEEADRIERAIEAVNPEHVRKASGLEPGHGFVLVEHDHHNIRFQQLADAVHKLGNYRITVKMSIPDYHKIQGTILGEKLARVLNSKALPYDIERIDAQRGDFEIVLPRDFREGSGFNFGDLAHPISDPIEYGGLGLTMSYPGHKGQGGMDKDPELKAKQFQAAGKKRKPVDPELQAAYQRLFP